MMMSAGHRSQGVPWPAWRLTLHPKTGARGARICAIILFSGSDFGAAVGFGIAAVDACGGGVSAGRAGGSGKSRPELGRGAPNTHLSPESPLQSSHPEEHRRDRRVVMRRIRRLLPRADPAPEFRRHPKFGARTTVYRPALSPRRPCTGGCSNWLQGDPLPTRDVDKALALPCWHATFCTRCETASSTTTCARGTAWEGRGL